MAEKIDAATKPQETKSFDEGPRAQLLASYIKDLSFENIAIQTGHVVQKPPKFDLNLNLSNKEVTDGVYEVEIDIEIRAHEEGNTVFLLELKHAGRFRLHNTDETNRVGFLYIECPRLLYPYTRRIISGTTVDGGLAPLHLDHIDFVQVFQNSLEAARKKTAQEKAQ